LQSLAIPAMLCTMLDATACYMSVYEITRPELLAKARLNRCLHRFYNGISLDCKVAANQSVIEKNYAFEIENFKFLTLTTPEDFDKESLNHAWRLFSLRMKRRAMWGDYYAVREWNAKGTCEHLHVILKVQKLDYAVVSEQWTHCVNASLGNKRKTIWTNVQHCYSRDGSVKGLANYVSKYLTKQTERLDMVGSKVLERHNVVMDKSTDKFDHIETTTTNHDNGYLKRFGRSYWYSFNWIFSGWRLITKLLWRLGSQVDMTRLIELKALSKINRLVWTAKEFTAALKSGVKLSWSITLSKELRQMGILYELKGREISL